MSETKTITAAEEAVVYLLRLVQRDPRVAYYIGPCSGSLEKLTKAYAEMQGLDHKTFHATFERELQTEAPRCRECPSP